MMKNIITFCALMCITFTGFSQYYYLPYLNNPGNPGGVNDQADNLNSANGWTDVLTGGVSDQYSASQTIPFTFDFNGSTVSNFVVSTTGFVTFDVAGATGTPASANAALPSASLPAQTICAWGLTGTGGNDALRTQVFGTSPNQQLWIQFMSYSTPGGSTSQYNYWAIVLEETTNNIYVVDQGGNTGTSGPGLTIGIQIDSANAIQVSGSPNVKTQSTNSHTTEGDNDYYKFIAGVQPDYDVNVVNVLPNEYAVLSGNNDVQSTVTNLGAQTITSLEVSYQIDNGTPVVNTVSGLSLNTSDVATITHPDAWVPSTPAVEHQITFTVTKVNGNTPQNTGDDEASSMAFVHKGTTSPKKVMIEEFTTAPCGYCTDGKVVLDGILNTYTNVIGVAHHAGFGTDAMTISESSTYSSTFGSGAPMGNVDRVLFEGQSSVNHSRSYWETNAQAQMLAHTPCEVSLSYTDDPSTDLVDLTVEVNYSDYDRNGDYRITVFVIEDSLVGQGSQWDQRNYYSGQGSGVGGPSHPMYNFGDPIIGYVHDHVVRAVLTDQWGDDKIINPDPKPGDKFTANFNGVDISSYNHKHLSFIAFVSKYSGGNANSTRNAVKVHFERASTGLVDVTQSNKVNIYPNPANDFVVVDYNSNSEAIVYITDILGKIVLSQTITNSQTAVDVSNLSEGVYNIVVNTDNSQFSQKLNVVK